MTLLCVSQPVDLRYVDFQRALQRLPEAKAARERLEAQRALSQAHIDRMRQTLIAEREGLTQTAFAARAEAVEAKAAADTQALERLQDQLLSPLMARLERRRRRLERSLPAKSRLVGKVVRLDQVGLLGWPSVCDLTGSLAEDLANLEGTTLEFEPKCEARALRRVDLSALAADSVLARSAQADLEAFRRKEQATIDEQLRRVEALQKKARTQGEKRQALQARKALDRKVERVRKQVSLKKAKAEAQVLEELAQRLSKAAGKLSKIAVCEYADVELGLPEEDGFLWAQQRAMP